MLQAQGESGLLCEDQSRLPWTRGERLRQTSSSESALAGGGGPPVPSARVGKVLRAGFSYLHVQSEPEGRLRQLLVLLFKLSGSDEEVQEVQHLRNLLEKFDGHHQQRCQKLCWTPWYCSPVTSVQGEELFRQFSLHCASAGGSVNLNVNWLMTRSIFTYSSPFIDMMSTVSFAPKCLLTAYLGTYEVTIIKNIIL